MSDSTIGSSGSEPDAKKSRLLTVFAPRIAAFGFIAIVLAVLIYPDRHAYWPCKYSTIKAGMSHAELAAMMGCEPGDYTLNTWPRPSYGCSSGEFFLPTDSAFRAVLWQFDSFAYVVYLDRDGAVVGKNLYKAAEEVSFAANLGRRVVFKFFGPPRWQVRE